VHLLGGFTSLDRITLDPLHHQRALLKSSGDSVVVLVTIDPPTVDKLGKLPWNPDLQRKLLLPILEGEATRVGIALDAAAMFGSPEHLAPELVPYLEEGRLVLARSSMVFNNPYLNLGSDACKDIEDEWPGDDSVLILEPDGDGRVRHHQLGIQTRCGYVTSLEQILAGGSASTERVHLDGRGAAASVLGIPAVKIIDREVGTRIFKDRTVIVGEIADTGTVLSVPTAPRGWIRGQTTLRVQITAALKKGLEPRGSAWIFLLLVGVVVLVLGTVIARTSPLVVSLATLFALAALYALAAAFEWILHQPSAPTAGALSLIGVALVRMIGGEQKTYQRLRTIVANSRRSKLAGVGLAPDWPHLANSFQVALGATRVDVGTATKGASFQRLASTIVEGDEEMLGPFQLTPLVWRLLRHTGMPRVLEEGEWSEARKVLAIPVGGGLEIEVLVLAEVEDADMLVHQEMARLRNLARVAGHQAAGYREALRALPTHRVPDKVDDLMDELEERISLVHGNRVQAESALHALPHVQIQADALGTIRMIAGVQLEAFDRLNSGAVPGARLLDVLVTLSGRSTDEVQGIMDRCRRRAQNGTLKWDDPDLQGHIWHAEIHPIRGSSNDSGDPFSLKELTEGVATDLHHGYLCTIAEVSARDEEERAVALVVEAMSVQAKTHLNVLQWGLELATSFEVPDKEMLAGLRNQVSALRRLFNIFHQHVSKDDSTGRRMLPVDLAQLVRQAVSPLTLPSEVNDRVELELPELVSPVLVDVSTLSPVLRGLVMDSLNNSPRGSKTRVQVREMIDEVQVLITDEGFGFPQSVLDVMSQPEARLSAEGDDLADAVESVQRAGGTLHIDSRIAEGTTYRLVFPKTPAVH
jgi:CHASE2 domain-containing sensor protein/signal transduction histidine kinase